MFWVEISKGGDMGDGFCLILFVSIYRSGGLFFEYLRIERFKGNITTPLSINTITCGKQKYSMKFISPLSLGISKNLKWSSPFPVSKRYWLGKVTHHFFNVFGCFHYSVIPGNSYKCRKTGVSVPQCWISRGEKQKKRGDITNTSLCHWSLTAHILLADFSGKHFFLLGLFFFSRCYF